MQQVRTLIGGIGVTNPPMIFRDNRFDDAPLKKALTLKKLVVNLGNFLVRIRHTFFNSDQTWAVLTTLAITPDPQVGRDTEYLTEYVPDIK